MKAVNQAMDFFGDRTLSNKQIGLLIDNIYSEAELNADDTMDYAEYVTAICNHPTLVRFLTQ